MKPTLLLLAFSAALIFSSCTSAYKTTQTPDDVYYSPVRPQEEYVQVEKQDDRRYQGSDEYYEDRYLRMRVQDPYRWSQLDDYYYNSPYAYNYYGGNWNSPYNNYWCWNTYYNPYYNSHIIGGGGYYPNPKAYIAPPSRPIAFNPASYGGNPGNNRPAYNSRSVSNSSYTPSPRYNNTNSNSSLGGSIRKVFSNENSSNSSYQPSASNSTPSRSYTPSSSSSSSSSTPSSSSSSSSSGSSGGGRPNR